MRGIDPTNRRDGETFVREVNKQIDGVPVVETVVVDGAGALHESTEGGAGAIISLGHINND